MPIQNPRNLNIPNTARHLEEQSHSSAAPDSNTMAQDQVHLNQHQHIERQSTQPSERADSIAADQRNARETVHDVNLEMVQTARSMQVADIENALPRHAANQEHQEDIENTSDAGHESDHGSNASRGTVIESISDVEVDNDSSTDDFDRFNVWNNGDARRHMHGYQMTHSRHSNGLNSGAFDRSEAVQQYALENPDPSWIAFCNKFQQFIDDTGSYSTMILRIEALISQVTGHPELENQINRIAQDSTTNCQDAAIGSLLEMEKANVRFQMIRTIQTSENQKAALSQVLELAHGFHNLEAMETLAHMIARSEEIEAFLYILQHFSTLINVPIEAADFRHQQYAEALHMDVNGVRTILNSELSHNAIEKKLLEAMVDHTAFSKKLADFKPFHEYLHKYCSNSNHATIAEKIQAKAQALSLDISQVPSSAEDIQSHLEKIKQAIDQLVLEDQNHILFSEQDISDIKNDVLQYSTQKQHQSYSEIQDQSTAFQEHLHRLEQGDLGPLTGDWSVYNNDVFKNAFESQEIQGSKADQTAKEDFELNFMTQKANNLIMRLYNNAQRISYFNTALEYSSLFLATINIDEKTNKSHGAPIITGSPFMDWDPNSSEEY